MRIIKVQTLNSLYEIEENDAGERKIISTTNDRLRENFVGRKVFDITIGKVILLGKGSHTSKVISIE